MRLRRSKDMWKAAAAAATVILVFTGVLGALGFERLSKADSPGNGIAETEEISTADNNGPQPVTSLDDMRLTNINIEYGTGSSAGAITGNEILLADINDTEIDSVDTHNSMITVSSDLPIKMNLSWKLDLDALLSKYEKRNTGSSIIQIKLSGSEGTTEIGVSAASEDRFFIDLPTGRNNIDRKEFGVKKNITLSYDALTDEYSFKYGPYQYNHIPNPYPGNKTVTLSIRGKQYYIDEEGKPADYTSDGININMTKVKVNFNSFQYTDYYLKATNHLTDYADRRITGAVGSGHTVSVHPTIWNNETNSQRIAGTISLDNKTGISNITPLDNDKGENIVKKPVSYQMDESVSKDYAFQADITSGPYAPGQKICLPLLVQDSGFSDPALSGYSGAPGTWYNLQYNSGDGLKPQLPLKLKLEKDTSRGLIGSNDSESGFDYEYSAQGKTTAPNANGWYNGDVTVTIKSDPAEFDELNFSTASGEDKVTKDSIKYTARTDGLGGISDSFAVSGSGENGSSATVKGETYAIFGRKGNNTLTETLSAVSYDTFRIDQGKPVIGDFDRSGRTFSATDNLSGIDYYEYKYAAPGEKFQKGESVDHKDKNCGYTSLDKIDLPDFTKVGSYIIRAVDMAGNISEPKTISNTAPVIKASDNTLAFKDTIAGLSPVKALKASVTDAEEKIEKSRLAWKIEKNNFNTVTGEGEEMLPNYLPAGKYKVTFSLNGDGKDSDGNKALEVTVSLTIVPDAPPLITDTDTPSGDQVPGNLKTDPEDGTKHYYAEDEKVIIVDPSDYYNNGKLTVDDAAAEIEEQFGFSSRLPKPADSLKVTVMLQDKNGNDITNDASKGYIDTTKGGSYKVIYRVTDLAGCTTTLEMTYVVRENVTVTFHSGKGDYQDGTTERSITVKVNKAPAAADIPHKSSLLPPARTCYAGWGTKINAAGTVDPAKVPLSQDTTYYALYVPDTNENGIPDSEEAIFIFKSSDQAHAAFKYADKTTVGILVPAGSMAVISNEQIPELLFERTTDKSYRVKGYKTDATGDDLLTSEELCQLGRGPGTKLNVTVIIEEYSIKDEGKVLVTFFSSEPKLSPLDGGEGQTMVLEVPEPGQPVTIPKEKLPGVKLGEDCKLEGWKTSDTGDLIMPAEEVAKQKLYGGREVTCIAYVKPPAKSPEKEVVKKEKEVVTKEKVIKKETVKIKPEVKKDVLFFFYTSRPQSGVIESGDGTAVILPPGENGKASISKKLVPELQVKEESTFIGWKTSFTGGELLSTKQLCGLNVPAGTTVSCTAYFKYNEARLKKSDNSKSQTGGGKGKALTSIGDNPVPLGSSPGFGGRKSGDNPSCIVHYLMIIWLVLLALTILWRIHNRKRSEEILLMDMDSLTAEGRTMEDIQNMADSQRTDIRDYLFLVCGAVIGIALFQAGTCQLELPLLILGAALGIYYFVRLKLMDKKDRLEIERKER